MVIVLMQIISYVMRGKNTFYIYYRNYWGLRTKVQLQLQVLIETAF